MKDNKHDMAGGQLVSCPLGQVSKVRLLGWPVVLWNVVCRRGGGLPNRWTRVELWLCTSICNCLNIIKGGLSCKFVELFVLEFSVS